MKTLPFVKMHGAGNDFILVDDRDGSFPIDDYMRVAAMAARRVGVGCEGVILVQSSDRADFRMRFFNPDGSEADLCGNGARCVAWFARSIGAAKGASMRFETAVGDVEAEILDERLVRIAMPAPRDFEEDFVVAGVPHFIVPVENLSAADVDAESASVRASPPTGRMWILWCTASPTVSPCAPTSVVSRRRPVPAGRARSRAP